MEPNTCLSRKSFSLSNRINQSRSGTEDDNVAIEEPSTLRRTPSRSPPRNRLSLDRSIDISPSFLNSSFSPCTHSSQASEYSEVIWKWSQKMNRSHNYRFNSQCTKKKRLPKRRQTFLIDIESKMRKDDNNRTDEMLKRRCAKFRVDLLSDENLCMEKNINKTQNEIVKSQSSGASTKKYPLVNTIDDFFNNSDADDFLLEATEQVENEILGFTKNSTVKSSHMATPRSTQILDDKRSCKYMKLLKDDISDDVFRSLDDIVEQAIKDTRTKRPFQRFNSLPSDLS